jgi:hypothetical protein
MPSTFLVDFPNAYVGDASIRPQAALTASANGGGVDMLKAEGPVTLLVANGATDFASLDETYVVKLQESDTSGGTYADISGAPTVAVSAANALAAVATQLRTKRWVRAVVTIGGTTPSILIAAVVFALKKTSGTGGGQQL